MNPHFASAFGMSGIMGACSFLRVGGIVERPQPMLEMTLMGIKEILMLQCQA
jgi:hypothetical protein